MGEVASMRKDWDYVEFADYQHDMDESREQAVAVVGFVKRRETEALRRLAITELALADALRQLGKGATASVYISEVARLPDMPKAALLTEFSPYDDCWKIRLEGPKTQP